MTHIRSVHAVPRTPQVSIFEVVVREPGAAKLRKPAELRGCSPVGSAVYITGRCTCPVIVSGGDVWVKHRDYFSPAMPTPPELAGTPLATRMRAAGMEPRRGRFVYDDAWGEIVLRREAWLRVTGLIDAIRAGTQPATRWEALARAHEQAIEIDEFDLDSTDMSRFWENVDDLVAAHAQPA